MRAWCTLASAAASVQFTAGRQRPQLERKIEVPMCVAGEERAVALAPREVHGVEHRPFGAPQQHRACPCDRPAVTTTLGTPCATNHASAASRTARSARRRFTNVAAWLANALILITRVH